MLQITMKVKYFIDTICRKVIEFEFLFVSDIYHVALHQGCGTSKA